MSTPAAPPPHYADVAAKPSSSSNTNKTYGAADSAEQPLLQPGGPSSRSSHDQPWLGETDADNLPDDFKYGTNVSECDLVIRMGFIRKVYSILFAQIVATTIVAAVMRHPAISAWTRENSWVMYIPMFATFITLAGLFFKRHEHPANMILLGFFTLCESLLIGTITSYYQSTVVLQALLITIGVFLGLTLFTMQSKYDFSSMGPLLFAGLIGLVVTGLVQMFLPFNKTADLFIAGFGVLLFSGYTVYDTHMIMKRLSPDEYIMGALSLYLDFINLFLNILRVLNNTQRD